MQRQQAAVGPADPWVLPFRPGSGHSLQVLCGLLTFSPLHPCARLTVATVAVLECLKCLPISGASYSSSLQPTSTLYKVLYSAPTPPLHSYVLRVSTRAAPLPGSLPGGPPSPGQTRPLDTKEAENNLNYYCITPNTYRTLAVCQTLF